MSCCGGNCGCGSGCKCGNGCGSCNMYPEVEPKPIMATPIFLADATHKASSGGSEMATENGGCDCNTCKCGTSCGCSCCSCN